jgi:hypothetical protein
VRIGVISWNFPTGQRSQRSWCRPGPEEPKSALPRGFLFEARWIFDGCTSFGWDVRAVVQPLLRPLATPAADPQLALATASTGCAGFKPPTCVGCSTSGSTGGQPSGSDRCSVLRLDRWQAPGFHRLLCASVRPGADLPACAGVHPPARPATNCRLTPGADSSARLVPNFRLSPVVVAAFGLRLLLLRLLQLALGVARLPYRRRTSDSHRLLRRPASPVSTHSTCVECSYFRLGLRCTPCFDWTLHRRTSRR